MEASKSTTGLVALTIKIESLPTSKRAPAQDGLGAASCGKLTLGAGRFT